MLMEQRDRHKIGADEMSLVIKDLLNIAIKRLEQANCPTPKLDAEMLLLFYLGHDRSFLFAHYADELDDKRSEAYFELVDERATGKPLQYITGRQEFMGISFMVSESVLIPRQDTEALVEEVIKIANEKNKTLGSLDILDLCCGGGAICVSLAYYLTKVRLVALDISKKALSIAMKNAADYKLSGKIKFIQGDMFSPLKIGAFGSGKFDMIVSNPPYIKSDVLPTLQREIFEHEPLIALDGGVDGLDFYKKIIARAPKYLKKHGLLLLEIGYDQATDIKELLSLDGRYEEPQIVKDLTGHDRIVKVELQHKKGKKAK